jgi:hypothetical protein
MKAERSLTMAPTKFIAVNLTPGARDVLRLRAVTVSAAMGRRVSMSDALLVIDQLATDHSEEIAAVALRVLEPEGNTPS